MDNFAEKTRQLKEHIELFIKNFEIKELRIESIPLHKTEDGKVFNSEITIEIKL